MHGATILVVEDHPEIRTLTKVFLERAGYAVITAADGAEGLRVYKQHQARIALLLTDVTMPKMNGLDLADRVLEVDAQLPVLFMSGSVQPADRCCGCLAKPFKSFELVRRVEQVLDASGRRAQAAS